MWISTYIHVDHADNLARVRIPQVECEYWDLNFITIVDSSIPGLEQSNGLTDLVDNRHHNMPLSKRRTPAYRGRSKYKHSQILKGK